MSRAIGPVLATGAITVANRTILLGKPMDWRVPVATGLAACGVALIEQAWPKGARMMAWTMLLAVLVTRVNPQEPAPAETLLAWWTENTPKYVPPGQ